MSVRLLNRHIRYIVSWIKPEPIGDFSEYSLLTLLFICSVLSPWKTSRKLVEWIPKSRKFWAQSGVKCSILEKRVFPKYPLLSLCFNDGALWSFKLLKESLEWILKTMLTELWAKTGVKCPVLGQKEFFQSLPDCHVCLLIVP